MCFLTLFCGFRGVVLSVLWCKIVKVRVQDSQSCALTLSFLRCKIDYLAWQNAMFSDFPGDFSGWRRRVLTSISDIYHWFTIPYIKTLVKLKFPPKNLVCPAVVMNFRGKGMSRKYHPAWKPPAHDTILTWRGVSVSRQVYVVFTTSKDNRLVRNERGRFRPHVG